MKQPLDGLIQEVYAEVSRATELHGSMASTHEALGIIREEYIEFEDEVFLHNPRKGPDRDRRSQMRAEPIQLAAMAVRAIHDCDLRPVSA